MGCLIWKKKKNTTTATNHNNKEMEKEKWAKVIWTSGELREFAVPVTVEHVLREQSNNGIFICNSDNLYFDQPIPALHAHDHLRADGIYFALHDSERHIRLSASDMAAMALKATAAIETATLRRSNSRRKQQQKKKQSRISPIVGLRNDDDDGDQFVALSPDYDYQLTVNNNKTPSSSSIKITKSSKLQRVSSRARRSNLALRSFKLRLSTIYESA